MRQQENISPDSTAVRTALWRALHKQIDGTPPILNDEVGLQLVNPPQDWQERPDMKYTRRLRASIVARARFIEDLIVEQCMLGVSQYVILGAGLDTFAQRHPELVSRLKIFEIDQNGTLTWKRKRLTELGFGMLQNLHFVPVDFETESWWEKLSAAGFDRNASAVVVCTGVTLYLSQPAIVSMLHQMKAFMPGTTLAIAFYLPMHLLDNEDRGMQEIAEKGARAAGTPFVSFFDSEQVRALAEDAGIQNVTIISAKDMEQRYFANRTDGLAPASGEIFLLARR